MPEAEKEEDKKETKKSLPILKTEAEKLLGITVTEEPKINKAKLFGIIVLLAFFGGFGLWAVLAPLESAAVAPGKVIVSGYRRTIQHLEGGIVKAIYVKDGSKVKQGQVLIKLDDTRAKIALQLSRSEVHELMAIEARLKAERDDAKKVVFSKRLLEEATDDKKLQRIMESQRSIFKANKKNLQGSFDILRKRIELLKEQIKGVEAQIEAATRRLKFIKEEIKAVAYLEKRKLIDKPRLLALLRQEARLIGERGENLAKASSLKQKIGETQLQLTAVTAKYRKEVLTQLRETQQKLADALEKEKAAEDVLNRSAIRAPQYGTIVGLKFHTIGGVIKPGEALMDIVPSKDTLIVEARVTPLDIDVVHAGLKARVQLTAFKQRVTPSLMGEVTHVSADAISDQKTNATFYLAKVKIGPKELEKLKKNQKLYPGMPVQVMIITDKLTPWQYFIAPIRQSFDRAFREQ